ncbi:MAG: helix-turn-helix domain-containing protein, partial [Wenzhouxiangella sp.]
ELSRTSRGDVLSLSVFDRAGEARAASFEGNMGKLNGAGPCLHEFVRATVNQYLNDMGATPPDNLYEVLISEVERPLIEEVLRRTGGNQSRSAEILGITRATLRNRIQRYRIDPHG